ncbi:MAG: hypothetical protein Kow00107_00660 [Planctomycetota bacterium]
MSNAAIRRYKVLLALAVVALTAALSFACGGRGGGNVRPSKAKTIVSGAPEGYEVAVAERVSFWASRWQVLNYSMMSRAGVPTVIDAAEMDYLKYLAGPYNGIETPIAPTNASFTLTPFRYGNPAYSTGDDGSFYDFGDEGWLTADSQSAYDTLTTALLIMAETEWARQFHSSVRFGSAEDSPTGATERLHGLILCELAKRTALHYINNRALYSETPLTSLRMTAALADLARLLREPTIGGQENRYRDVNFSGQLLAWMDYYFDVFTSAPAPVDADGLCEGIVCLGYYATTTLDASLRAQALTLVRTWADALVSLETNDPVEHACRIRGILEAGRLLLTNSYLQTASDVFEVMQADYRSMTGVFESRFSLTGYEIARIIGALNALRTLGTGYADTDWASLIMSDFIASSVFMSGLWGRTYPIEYVSQFERPARELDYKFPNVLNVRDGEGNGAAPYFATRVQQNEGGNGWTVSSTGFDAVAALSLALEMLWLRPSEFNPWPNYSGGLSVPLRYGQSGFTYPVARSNAYYTGRTAAIEFALRSSAGSSFEVSPDAVAAMLSAVSSPSTGDPAAYPSNPALLRMPYDYSSPAFSNPYNGVPTDWSNYRWTSVGGMLSDLSLANLMLVEARLARHFHDDSLFGEKDVTEFGAPERLKGMMLFKALAQQIVDLERDSFGLSRTYDGRCRLLMALCEAADLVSASAQPNSTTNRYYDVEMHQDIDSLIEETYQYIVSNPVPDSLAGLRSLSDAMFRYALYVSDFDRAAEARRMVLDCADAGLNIALADIIDKSNLVVILDNALKLNAGGEISTELHKTFVLMTDEYDPYYGTFSSIERYTSEQIGTVLDALIVCDRSDDALIDPEAAQNLLKGFIEGTFLLSGFTRSAWAPWEYPSYEYNKPDLWFRYPSLPYPLYAGGANGIAPVFARQIEFVPFGGYWNVLDTISYTPGLLHCSESLLRCNFEAFPLPAIPAHLR